MLRPCQSILTLKVNWHKINCISWFVYKNDAFLYCDQYWLLVGHWNKAATFWAVWQRSPLWFWSCLFHSVSWRQINWKVTYELPVRMILSGIPKCLLLSSVLSLDHQPLSGLLFKQHKNKWYCKCSLCCTQRTISYFALYEPIHELLYLLQFSWTYILRNTYRITALIDVVKCAHNRVIEFIKGLWS